MLSPNETSRYARTTRPRHFNLSDAQRRNMERKMAQALSLDEVPTLVMQRDAEADLRDAQRQLNSIAEIASVFGETV